MKSRRLNYKTSLKMPSTQNPNKIKTDIKNIKKEEVVIQGDFKKLERESEKSK